MNPMVTEVEDALKRGERDENPMVTEVEDALKRADAPVHDPISSWFWVPDPVDTRDLAHIRFFVPRAMLDVLRPMMRDLGMTLQQTMLLFIEIGMAVAPTLVAQQQLHNANVKRAVNAAKREHGRKVRRDVASGQYGQRLRAQREAAKAKKAKKAKKTKSTKAKSAKRR